MNKYKREIENLKNNIHYGNCVSFKDFKDDKVFGFVEITKKLFDQADFLLFFKQDKEQQKESDRQIKKLRLDIRRNPIDFPALGIIKHPKYNFIADGNHRIYALFKEGIKRYEAIYLKRSEEEC